MASFSSIPQEAYRKGIIYNLIILISLDILIIGTPIDIIQSRNALILEDSVLKYLYLYNIYYPLIYPPYPLPPQLPMKLYYPYQRPL